MATSRPVLSARIIDYDVSHRDRAIAHGGIGLIHTLVLQSAWREME